MTSQQIIGALRHLAAEYIRGRRASGELRTRLVAFAQQRARVPDEDAGRRPAEIERVRTTLERSARVADERLRALEAVIAAVAVDAVRAMPARVVDGAQPRRHPVGAVHPVRGGWVAPG